MKKSNEEKTYATLKLGKTYKFAGYNWMVCEVDNDRHAVVIQSRGVTYGPWPGFKMAKFGGEINTSFATDIDGEDISTYDDKMQKLYNAIKYAEDKKTPVRSGLPTTMRGLVPSTVAAARGMLIVMVTSTNIFRITKSLSLRRPLISIYRRLKL